MQDNLNAFECYMGEAVVRYEVKRFKNIQIFLSTAEAQMG